jgi:hypothetical protein
VDIDISWGTHVNIFLREGRSGQIGESYARESPKTLDSIRSGLTNKKPFNRKCYSAARPSLRKDYKDDVSELSGVVT